MPVITPKLGLAYLALVKQSVQGTAVVPSTGNNARFPILTKQAFMPTQDINELRTGTQRDIGFATKNKFLYTGSFETYLFADEGAALMAWLFGTDTKTGSGDPWTHTLTLTEPLPYLTAEVSWYQNSLIERVIDCKIAKIEITFEARKEIMLTVHLLGCSVAVQSSPQTPSFTNVVSGNGEGPMRFADSTFTLTGPADATTVALEVQKLVITIDQGVVDMPGPGQTGPIALVEEGRKISYKGTAMFTTDAIHRLTFYGASAGTTIASAPSTGSLVAVAATSASPARSATFTINQNFWTLTKPMFDLTGKTGTMDFEATAYRAGATLPMTAVFLNGYNTSYTA